MVSHHRIATALALAVALAGCKKPPPEPPLVSPPLKASPDQLAPGEIAEGKELAFGLPLPRRFAVTARFTDAVFATGDIAMDDVANYMRARVKAEHVETGPAKTLFADAKVKKAPDRLLSVEVLSKGTHTQIIVRDMTRPVADPGVSEEERWRRLGLTPDGKPLDPTHLE